MNLRLLSSVATLLALSASFSFGQIILNTGQGTSNPGDLDPNWKVVATGTGTASMVADPTLLTGATVINGLTFLDPVQAAVRTEQNTVYVNPPANSAWIWEVSNTNYPEFGIVRFELEIDLTGKDVSTAILAGEWSVDNAGIVQLVNSKGAITLSSREYVSGQIRPYTSLASFSAQSSDLVSGMNRLVVTTINAANTTGNPAAFLLVGEARAVTGGDIADLVPVPEPATYGLIGALLLLGVIAQRRLRQARR